MSSFRWGARAAGIAGLSWSAPEQRNRPRSEPVSAPLRKRQRLRSIDDQLGNDPAKHLELWLADVAKIGVVDLLGSNGNHLKCALPLGGQADEHTATVAWIGFLRHQSQPAKFVDLRRDEGARNSDPSGNTRDRDAKRALQFGDGPDQPVLRLGYAQASRQINSQLPDLFGHRQEIIEGLTKSTRA